MANRKRLISMIAALSLTALIIISVFFVSERNKKYPLSEKSVIAMGTVVTEKIYSENPGTAIRDITSIINGLEDTIS